MAGVPQGTCRQGFAPGTADGCAPVLPSAACPRGTKERLGSKECESVGVPVDGCSEGFATDKEGGCTPLLPAAACPTGTLAVPGDTSCREVMPCGQGLWGDAPIDAATQFVDASYDAVAKGPSDGTEAHPWTTLQAAVDVAAKGAVVAITDGTYAENVAIHGQAVRLWGRCPETVEIVGTAAARSTLDIQDASGTEVHGVALRGDAKVSGVGVYGSSSVVLDRLWIHDHDVRGVHAEPGAGETSLLLTGSLVERAREQGMSVTLGAKAEIAQSVIRDIEPRADKTFGRGLGVQSAPTGKRSAITVTRSVFERNHDVNVIVIGSDATFEGSVIRDTQPQASGQERGWGIAVQADPASKQQGSLTLDGCWIGNNHDLGLFASGSHATLHRTVIRDTLSHQPDLLYGQAIEVIPSSSAGQPGLLTVEESLIADNRSLAVSITGSEATFEKSIVRGTQPQEADKAGGRGIEAGYSHDIHGSSTLSLKGCLLEDNRDVALFVWGSTASIEDTTIRGTLAEQSSASAGRGIEAQNETEHDVAASIELLRSVVEDNHEAGVFVSGAKLLLDSSIVRRTLANETTGRHGYGVVIAPDGAKRSTATLTGSLLDGNHDAGLLLVGSDGEVTDSTVRGTLASPSGKLGDGVLALMDAHLRIATSEVRDNARAGAAALGSALTLQATWLSCNANDVVTEDLPSATPGAASLPATLVDGANNACGCGEELTRCVAERPMLTSPVLPALPRLKTAH